MEVRIENLTGRPVILNLNSGDALHLAPGSISATILAVEVKDNSFVQKLRDRRIVAVRSVADPAAPGDAAPAAPAAAPATGEAEAGATEAAAQDDVVAAEAAGDESGEPRW